MPRSGRESLSQFGCGELAVGLAPLWLRRSHQPDQGHKPAPPDLARQPFWALFHWSISWAPPSGHTGSPGTKQGQEEVCASPLISAGTCNAHRLLWPRLLGGSGLLRRMYDAKKPAWTQAKRTKVLLIGVHAGK